MNDANFLQLDCVLARVRRRTKQEVVEERMKREVLRKFYCAHAGEERQSCGGRSEIKHDQVLNALEDDHRTPAYCR